MPIKNLTKTYRPVRQGKIHLGVKKIKQTEKGAVEYPSEVNYFVLRECPELIHIYGPDPENTDNPDGIHLELHVTLLSARFDRKFDDYLEKVIPQYYKRYRLSGLYCKGDGENAVCINTKTGELDEIECPCEYLESGECKRIAIFRFRIQEIPSFNIYQISTTSSNSIKNINSFIRDLLEHCYVNDIDPSSVKLSLRRELQIVQRMEEGKPKKSKHFIMVLDLDRRFYKSLDDVRTRALPGGETEPKKLPPPMEDKDPLLFPDEEAKKVMEEEKERTRVEEQKNKGSSDKSKLDILADILDKAIIEFMELGGKLSDKEKKRIKELKKEEELQNAYKYYKTETGKLRDKLREEEAKDLAEEEEKEEEEDEQESEEGKGKSLFDKEV